MYTNENPRIPEHLFRRNGWLALEERPPSKAPAAARPLGPSPRGPALNWSRRTAAECYNAAIEVMKKIAVRKRAVLIVTMIYLPGLAALWAVPLGRPTERDLSPPVNAFRLAPGSESTRIGDRTSRSNVGSLSWADFTILPPTEDEAPELSFGPVLVMGHREGTPEERPSPRPDPSVSNRGDSTGPSRSLPPSRDAGESTGDDIEPAALVLEAGANANTGGSQPIVALASRTNVTPSLPTLRNPTGDASVSPGDDRPSSTPRSAAAIADRGEVPDPGSLPGAASIPAADLDDVDAADPLSAGRSLAQRLAAARAHPGELAISLFWDNRNDFDLHVICPDGKEIWYRKDRQGSGWLDVDMNANAELIHDPTKWNKDAVEHVFFPEGDTPRGRYRVEVVFFMNNRTRIPGQVFEDCVEPTAFAVNVAVKAGSIEVVGLNGNERHRYPRSVEVAGSVAHPDQNAKCFVLEFDYTPPSTP